MNPTEVTKADIEANKVHTLVACGHCGKKEEPHWLFLHEASASRVCQECLGVFLQGDIEATGKGIFEGFEFAKISVWVPFAKHTHQVTNDEYMTTGTIEEVVEAVLMRLEYI